MSKFKLPDLPSDDDLGITDADRDFYAKEFGADTPEMSEAERRALLGDAKPTDGADAKPDRAAERKERKEAKRKEKEERRRYAAEKRRLAKAKKADKAGGPQPGGAPGKEKSPATGGARGAATTPIGKDAASASQGRPAEGAPAVRAPRAPEGPRSRWKGPATLAFLVAVSVVASSRTGLPRPVPANAADTLFSSSRAMSTLIDIARAAHPPGSPEHARVRGLLVERLRALGLEPEMQTTTVVLTDSLMVGPRRARAATVRNVLSRIPGSDPTGAVVLTAHYDGREISLAAGDDGTGVVAILEAVRALRAGAPLRNDLIVLFTDAEELGLLGARAFVDQHPWMSDVSIVLSFEMRGSAGPSIMFETNDQNGWVVRALDAFDPAPSANSVAFEVYRRMPNNTDFTVFRQAGKQGLNFAAIGNGQVYHQVYDAPGAVSESTVQHHGVHALSAARHFGDADLGQVNAPNVVYFDLPLLGLVVYGEALVLPITGALVLLFVGVLVVVVRGGTGVARPAIGLGVTLLGGALSLGAASALLRWVPRFHEEAGSLHGALYHGEGWYVLGLAGVVFAAVTGAHGIARRWLGLPELALGATVLPVSFATALAFVAPLGAMNLQWPALAALLSTAMVVLLGHRAGATVGWIGGLLLTLPVLLLLVPLTELVWMALTLGGLGIWVVVPITLALHLCLPAVDALRHPNAWWAPLTGLVVGAAAIGMGVMLARPDAARPSPSTLIYAYEHGTGAAVWATDPMADSLDARARAWAVERAASSFDGTRDLAGFAYRAGQVPTATAPVVAAPPPEVVITRDTIDGPVRRVTLQVRSRIGAEYLAFLPELGRGTRLIGINGTTLPDPGLERLEHWGEPDGWVLLDLEMPAEQPIGIHVVEHLLRPQELLGTEAFRRPPELTPDITRLSDRAMFRYSVAAFADPRHAIPMPGAAPPAGSVVLTDTTAVTPLAAPIPPDTTLSPPDTGSLVPDTLSGRRDTTSVGGSTGR